MASSLQQTVKNQSVGTHDDESVAIRFDRVSKQYRLGQVGTGTLSHDLHRFWAKLAGRPDPFASLGDVNDRTKAIPKKALASGRTKGLVESQLHEDSSDYVLALHDVSFDVNHGEIMGIIGRNGAGKSTLLKLLARITAPTSGRIHAMGKIANLLEVGTGFHPELTGRENIYLNGAILGMSRSDTSRQFDEIVEFSGCAKYIDTPIKRYSSGMTVRLGFAVAAHLKCDILVIDEVLAVGDADFQKKCIGRMQSVSQEGRTVLFVSHNMGAVAQLCDRCALLENGSLAFIGATSTAVQRYLATNGASRVQFNRNAQSDFQFSDVAIHDVNDKPSNLFAYDEPVLIVIGYQLEHRIDGLEIAVRIHSSNGTLVFTTHRSHQINDPVPTGQRTVAMTIPSNFLTPGDYTLDLGAHIPNQRMLDLKTAAISFRIEETGSAFAQFAGQEFGVVFCDCLWRDE